MALLPQGGVIDTLIKRFLYGEKATITWDRLESIFSKQAGNNSSSTLNNPRDYINAYQLITYVGKCVSRIAYDIASYDWEIKDDNDKERSGSKSEAIIKAPMAGMSYSEWQSIRIQHLLLDGNSFVLKDKTNALAQWRDNPNELAILNPAKVDIYDMSGRIISASTITNATKIAFYRVARADQTQVDIKPEDINHIKLPSPFNTMRGMGVVQQNAQSMDIDRLTSIFNNAFFNQGAKSNLFVTPERPLGPKEMSEYETQMRDKYEGNNNWGKIIILPNGSTVTPINMSIKDAQYIEQRQMTREDIPGFFDLPPMISGLFNDAKYDTAKEQIFAYQRITLPRYINVIQEGTTRIVEDIDGIGKFFIYPPAYDDYELQNTIASTLFDRGGLTLNEYRESMGYERIEEDHLNRFYMTMQYIPAEFNDTPPEPEPPPQPPEEEPSIDDEDGKAMSCCDHKATRNQLQYHRFASRIKYGVVLESIEDQELGGIFKSYIKEINAFYKKVEENAMRQLRKMHDDGIDIKAIEDVDSPVVIDKKELTASGIRMHTAGTAIVINELNRHFKTKVVPTFKNREYRLVVEKLAKNYANLTINSRRNELKRIVSNALSEGQSIDQVENALKTKFETLTTKNGYAARRIARTETSYAYDQSAMLNYDELGATVFDVVGCSEFEPDSDCGRSNIRRDEVDSLNFHPNHTGTIVPRRIV